MIFDPDDLRTLRPWLIDHVCRFWLARIHDPAGGFFENLDSLGAPVATPRRTTLVQARLTYVFSHAYLLSGDPVFREAAKHGLAFLMRAARAPDGGWFRVVSVDGATLDNTRDAYDHAFVLFALAWYCRATGDRTVIQLADATWEFMQQRLADPQHGGFFEEFAPGRTGMKLPRRQNPHMHLLEAVLALHAATGEKNWLRRADCAGRSVQAAASRSADRRADRVFRRGLVRRRPATKDGCASRATSSSGSGCCLSIRAWRATPASCLMPGGYLRSGQGTASSTMKD